MMNINMQDLTWLISHAVDAGVQEYMKGVDPSRDKVKKRRLSASWSQEATKR